MNARQRLQRQRGIASLVVVALLFFVLSLVAAYTSRNLIFEQRTSGNQYRSTQAFEAAEAGLEWALTMLNAGRIDAACAPGASTDTTFRQRYLDIDDTTGVIDPAGVLTPAFESTVWPSCVFNGTDWNCSCPAAGAPVLVAPVGAGVFPAFRVRFSRVSTTQPGVVRLHVNGCTRLDDACLDFPSQAIGGEGRATVSALIALRSGLPAPPVAALTVQGDINVGASFGAVNTDASGGLAILAGGSLSGTAPTIQGPAGTPSASSLRENDAVLGSLPVERPPGPYGKATLFTNTFSIWPDLYRDQPGAVVLDCSATCDAQDVRDAARANPRRVLWASGDVALDTGGAIGAPPDDPVLLVVAGDDVDVDGSTDAEIDIGVELHGLLYVFADEWSGSGGATVRGAVMADGTLGGAGTFTTVYDRATLDRLRWTTGSFVRVPGGWRDF